MSQYFLVTEKQLRKLVDAAANRIATYEMGTAEQAKAADKREANILAACLSLPVPEWATHFADFNLGPQHPHAERIPR